MALAVRSPNNPNNPDTRNLWIDHDGSMVGAIARSLLYCTVCTVAILGGAWWQSYSKLVNISSNIGNIYNIGSKVTSNMDPEIFLPDKENQSQSQSSTGLARTQYTVQPVVCHVHGMPGMGTPKTTTGGI